MPRNGAASGSGGKRGSAPAESETVSADSDDDEEEFEHFDAPIREEDEEEAEILSAGQDDNTFDEDETEGQVIIAPNPPVLDFEVPSPVDFTIPLASPT